MKEHRASKEDRPKTFMQVVRTHVSDFFSDPLDYALDKWMYLVFLGFGISILVGALKGVFKDIWSAIVG